MSELQDEIRRIGEGGSSIAFAQSWSLLAASVFAPNLQGVSLHRSVEGQKEFAEERERLNRETQRSDGANMLHYYHSFPVPLDVVVVTGKAYEKVWADNGNGVMVTNFEERAVAGIRPITTLN